MSKYPPNRQPDPNPMPVPARAASHRHESSRPQPGMPVVKWLDRANLAKAQRMTKTGKYTNACRVTLTDEQLALVEQAVKLSGKHFTEWVRPRLLAYAEKEIREHRERKLDAAE